MIKAIIIGTLIFGLFSSAGYGRKAAVLKEIMKPRTIAVDNTQLYVTEDAAVFIYSLEDFKLTGKFGREGQGPREFQTLPHVPISIDVSTGCIIVSSTRKISYFTRQGEFINEVKAVNLALKLRRHGDGFLGWSQALEDGVTYNTINIYDAALNKLEEVFRLKDSFQGPGRGYKVLHSVFTYHSFDGKILLPGKDDATIDIFDGAMNKLLSIHLDQERRKVDQKFQDQLIHNFKTNPQIKNIYEYLKPISFPDYFPVIADFFVDAGTVYIMTWKRENGSNEFFTYDMTGKFKKRLAIPIIYETDLDPYPTTITKGRLYQLVENENARPNEGAWEFHVSEIK